jgi:hypothetical protein
MVNVFPYIFTDIATPLRLQFPGIFVTGERVSAPAKFPCVEVIEADNYVVESSMDNTMKENITALMYEVTVFSNKTSGKRSQCIEILSQIDDIMRRKNGQRFVRTEGYFDSESSIYMIKARYRLKTDGYRFYKF